MRDAHENIYEIEYFSFVVALISFSLSLSLVSSEVAEICAACRLCLKEHETRTHTELGLISKYQKKGSNKIVFIIFPGESSLPVTFIETHFYMCFIAFYLPASF
jgi:hypothetical protein